MSDILQRHVGEAIVAVVDAHGYAYARGHARASAYARAYAYARASGYAVLVWRPASENTIVCCRDRAEALALYENDAVTLLPPGVTP